MIKRTKKIKDRVCIGSRQIGRSFEWLTTFLIIGRHSYPDRLAGGILYAKRPVQPHKTIFIPLFSLGIFHFRQRRNVHPLTRNLRLVLAGTFFFGGVCFLEPGIFSGTPCHFFFFVAKMTSRDFSPIFAFFAPVVFRFESVFFSVFFT